MRKMLIPLLFAGLILLAAFSVLQASRVQAQPGADGEVVLLHETQGDDWREITGADGLLAEPGAPNEPQISFIDSPTVACIQPDTAKNECFLQWYYLSVNGGTNYMITMTVELNDIGNVARYHGFFQTSLYVPHTMNPQGYKVACGMPGDGGDPAWGNSYPYTIRARDSAGLKASNYGTAFCPAYLP